MTGNRKATSPDLAEHMGEVAPNLQGQNFISEAKPQAEQKFCMCKALLAIQERGRRAREAREADEVKK
jgi:hypothetical protein